MEKKTGFVISKVTAFIAVGDDGDEGVIGMKSGNTLIPLIGADSLRVLQLIPIAIEICKMANKELKILEFSTRTDVTRLHLPF